MSAMLRPVKVYVADAPLTLAYLADRIERGGVVIDTKVNGKKIRSSQKRKESGPQQRGLAEAGLAEEDGQSALVHAPCQIGDLGIAAIEPLAVAFLI